MAESKASLQQIWEADDSDLIRVIEEAERIPDPDINANRVLVAQIYFHSKSLRSGDRVYVSNPRFEEIMLNAPDLEAGLLTLNELPNKHIGTFIKRLSMYYQGKEHQYRRKAFDTAGRAIEKYPIAITLENIDELKNVTGVGKSTQQEIVEFLETGTSQRLKALEDADANRKETIQLFRGIHGIGPVKADELYAEGYRTIEDLIDISDTFTSAQTIGFRWYYHLQHRIPRKEVNTYIDVLKPLLGEYDVDWTIAGSYRRGELTSGDIDVLVRGSQKDVKLKDVAQILIDQGIIVDTLASGPKKFMGIAQLPADELGEQLARRIDIRLFTPQAWPLALLYNTGSKELNVLMRQVAIKYGWRLNEYSLLDPSIGEAFEANTEEDVFTLLGLKYLPPEERVSSLVYLEPLDS